MYSVSDDNIIIIIISSSTLIVKSPRVKDKKKLKSKAGVARSQNHRQEEN